MLQLLGVMPGGGIVAVGPRLALLLSDRRAALWCGVALARHPYLVDYSGNGSPCLWIGLAALVIPWCAVERAWPAWVAGALAGLTVGSAATVHGAGLGLLSLGGIALLLARNDARATLGLTYVGMAVAVILPTLLWTHAHFGVWWHTTSYVFDKLGHLKMVDQSDGIRQVQSALGFPTCPRPLENFK